MKSLPKITVGVVLYKVGRQLKESMESLLGQDYPNVEFLLRDHSPNGEALKFLKKELPEAMRQAECETGENRWHSGGHNALIRRMNGDYYFCCSNDILYPSDLVSRMVGEMEKPENRHFGSAACKLRLWNPDVPESEQKTSVIDSCGLGITKAHRFYDIGQGEEDHGQHDSRRNIFGASGALTVFRKRALEDIVYMNEKGEQEFYDELIHYKNDADMAYRLQWAGWPCLFVPQVVAFHVRQTGIQSKNASRLAHFFGSRKAKSRWIRENSFFGQQAVLAKHFDRRFSAGVKFRTLLRQWMSLFFALVLEPYLLKQLRTLKFHEKELLAKRQAMKRVASAKTIESLMVN